MGTGPSRARCHGLPEVMGQSRKGLNVSLPFSSPPSSLPPSGRVGFTRQTGPIKQERGGGFWGACDQGFKGGFPSHLLPLTCSSPQQVRLPTFLGCVMAEDLLGLIRERVRSDGGFLARIAADLGMPGPPPSPCPTADDQVRGRPAPRRATRPPVRLSPSPPKALQRRRGSAVPDFGKMDGGGVASARGGVASARARGGPRPPPLLILGCLHKVCACPPPCFPSWAMLW